MGVNNKYTGTWSAARNVLSSPIQWELRREGKSWNVGHMELLRGMLSLPEGLIQN